MSKEVIMAVIYVRRMRWCSVTERFGQREERRGDGSGRNTQAGFEKRREKEEEGYTIETAGGVPF